MDLKPHSQCPNCHRRGTLKEHQGVMDTFERYEMVAWQCVYCGAVCEKEWRRGMIVVGIERIVLAPGELEAMRNSRRQTA